MSTCEHGLGPDECRPGRLCWQCADCRIGGLGNALRCAIIAAEKLLAVATPEKIPADVARYLDTARTARDEA